MRALLIILCTVFCLTGYTQAGGPERNARIDQLLEQDMTRAREFKDSAGFYAARSLSASREAGYIHGIALALACQAAHTEYHDNNFVLAEEQARQSLEWFGRTTNKDNITAAWYSLGFAVFAQSRFDEAIGYLEQARSAAAKAGDSVDVIHSLSLIGCAHRESGDYERAFEISRRCLQMAEDNHYPGIMESEYFELAELFIQIEDYSSAKKYFHAGFRLGQARVFSPWTAMVYAELLGRQQQYDSARYFYDRFDSAGANPAMLRTYLVSKGEFYLNQGKNEEALPYFEKSLVYQRQLNDRNQLMRCLKDLALVYHELGKEALSMRYARESLSIAGQSKARQFIRDNCHILYRLYDAAGRTDSAYAYYRRYIIMKDSVNNEQLKGKFASWSFEQQIALLNKERQLQDVCLRETLATKRLLIGGIVALLLIAFIFSRYVLLKRKNETHLRKRAENELEIQRLEGERAKSALQQRAKELEVQALRSQMNPHFIFNCLNAINRFILGHETESAADYLTKFSRLMRMTMNHSRHALITLAEELEVLQLYLDMEKLRFKNAFDYSITTDDDIEAGELYMPPLLLQPFVENAIWHGLMHKQERGRLSITINTADNALTCIIQDNGIGRRNAGLLKSKSAEKHKSMGLEITAERLALMTGKDGSGHSFAIQDLYDEDGKPAGTRVILTVRISHHIEAPV